MTSDNPTLIYIGQSLGALKLMANAGFNLMHSTSYDLEDIKKRNGDVIVVDNPRGTEVALEIVKSLRSFYPLYIMPIVVVCDEEQSELVVKLLDTGASDIISHKSDLLVFAARLHTQMRASTNTKKTDSLAKDYTPMPGDTIGHYYLESVLGAGGMGLVFRAKDLVLERYVALKALPEDAGIVPEYLARFEREGQIMAQLNHPQVVKVLDMGSRPINYLVMELIDGCDLDRKIALGNFPPKTACQVISQAAKVLHAVHTKGIVHRDLKPGNIIIDKFNKVHLLDFGISKLLNAEVLLTRPGNSMGTPAYMAPEQFESKLGSIDARTDIYALGVIVFELITGKTPFREDGFIQMIKEIVIGNPMSLKAQDPDIDSELDSIVLKATSRKPSKRYNSALEFALALDSYLAKKK